ncbi:hypothetical protein BD770DRAFT_455738 [Pilaira anomala]|nr:hypothetical protein BD770DRAFT_455738 [Pilaira anomala]
MSTHKIKLKNRQTPIDITCKYYRTYTSNPSNVRRHEKSCKKRPVIGLSFKSKMKASTSAPFSCCCQHSSDEHFVYSEDEESSSHSDSDDSVFNGFSCDDSDTESIDAVFGDAADVVPDGIDSFYHYNVLAPMENIVGSLDGSEDVSMVTSAFEDVVQEYPLEHSPSGPFKSILDFVIISFFHGGSVNISEQKIKLIMLMINVLFTLKEKNPDLKLPATDHVLNYDSRVKSRIPQ